jgi:hypothetical protein
MTKSFGPTAGAAALLLSAWGQNRQRSEGRTRVSSAPPGPKGEQAPPRTPRWKRRSGACWSARSSIAM